ncbi:MAG: glutathione S-transferase family protein, partial [Myxococcota bacterium]
GITLYHSPRTRSGRVKMLLDLLELPYTLATLDVRAGEHRSPAYLGLNPMGTVPTLVHHGQVILESIAQMMYVAELAPERGLAPAPGAPSRAAYLSLFALSAVTLEPWLMGGLRHPDDPERRERMQRALALLARQIVGPYCLGDAFSALDVLTHWNVCAIGRLGAPVDDHPNLVAYRDRLLPTLDWTEY